jgi:hypothetical protein
MYHRLLNFPFESDLVCGKFSREVALCLSLTLRIDTMHGQAKRRLARGARGRQFKSARPDQCSWFSSFLCLFFSSWLHPRNMYGQPPSAVQRSEAPQGCQRILVLTLEPIKQNSVSHAGGIGRARTLECHESAVGGHHGIGCLSSFVVIEVG